MEEEIKGQEASEKKPKSKKPLVIALVCVVAAALIACCVYFFVKNEQDHAPVPLAFSFEITDYDPQTGSGVPLYVEGVDLDGNHISEIVLADEGNTGVELLRGTYDISVVGSPVNGKGGIYAVPETVVHVEIDENGTSIDGAPASEEESEDAAIQVPAIKFAAVKPQDVTEKQIDAITAWMAEVGFSEELIVKFENLIIENREAGVKRAEEEALAAWRTKITGEFGGTGMYVGASSYISVNFNGDKLTVRGNLHRINEGSFSSSMGNGEWHFLLTDQTKYIYYGEYDKYTTKSEFVRCQPDSFVALSIEVKDGYVTSIGSGS